MRVIHFTHGATDPLKGFDASGASFLPLADGQGDTHISCLHLGMGGKIEAPSITHAAALPVVHGRVTIESDIGARIKFSGGMGAVSQAAAAPHSHTLLGQEWLAKWRRSDAQAPFGSTVEDVTWHEAVLEHPQFGIQKRL